MLQAARHNSSPYPKDRELGEHLSHKLLGCTVLLSGNCTLKLIQLRQPAPNQHVRKLQEGPRSHLTLSLNYAQVNNRRGGICTQKWIPNQHWSCREAAEPRQAGSFPVLSPTAPCHLQLIQLTCS